MALTKDITCHQAVALVSDYLEGALSGRDRRRLERHLEACQACSAYLEQMRITIAISGSVGGLNRPALIPGGQCAARICSFSSGSARR